MRLLGNKENYELDYSPAYFEKHLGISKDTSQKAFRTLVDRGYLRKQEHSESKFDLYPSPQVKRTLEECIDGF